MLTLKIFKCWLFFFQMGVCVCVCACECACAGPERQQYLGKLQIYNSVLNQLPFLCFHYKNFPCIAGVTEWAWPGDTLMRTHPSGRGLRGFPG